MLLNSFSFLLKLFRIKPQIKLDCISGHLLRHFDQFINLLSEVATTHTLHAVELFPAVILDSPGDVAPTLFHWQFIKHIFPGEMIRS